MKKKAYGKDAISDLIIGCIEKILVYPSGKLEVMVNKKAMAESFRLYSIYTLMSSINFVWFIIEKYSKAKKRREHIEDTGGNQ